MVKQEKYNNASNTNQWVDVFKFIFCICIIALHAAHIPQPAGYWIEKLLFRMAVPFFFVVSGFFLSNSSRERGVHGAAKRYCFRLLKILAVYTVVWVLQFLVDCIIFKYSLVETLDELIRRILFSPKNGLWFIQACIIGAILLIPFLRKNCVSLAIPIGVVLYGFALICNNYYFLIENNAVRLIIDRYMSLCFGPHNGVFVGFLFLGLGIFVEKHKKISLFINGILLGLSYVVYAIEIVIVRRYATTVDDGAFYLMQVAVAPLLLSLLVSLPGCFDSAHTILMRRLSTGMYLLHLPLIWCYHRFRDYCLPHIPVLAKSQGVLMICNVRFVLVLLTSWGICMFAYRNTKILKRFLS